MNDKYCPSTLRPTDGCEYCGKARNILFNGLRVCPFLDFNFDFSENGNLHESASHKISVSGVQEKYPAVIEGDRIRLAGKSERSTHILKPSPFDKSLRDRQDIPANEHLTMQIANQVYGIDTAANGLCFTPEGRPVYITRRFDILYDGRKLIMEDFASIIGKNELNGGKFFKYSGTYEEIAEGIVQNISASAIELERFLNMLVFNYIYANGDAHLKNFSLIKDDSGFRLAPAYDLINTALHVNDEDFALEGGLSAEMEKSEIWERTGHPCHLDFKLFADRTGIKKIRTERILSRYVALPEEVKVLISRSFLSPKAKRSYLRIITERLHRFRRN